MRRLLPAVIMIMLSQLCCAQRDSLWMLVRNDRDDTLKVLHYLDLGVEYEMTQPDSAILIYNMARDLSIKLDYPLGYCRYANAIAYPLEIYDRLDEKDSILFEAIKVCERHGMKRELARKYHSLGISEQMRRNYESSIDWYLKSLTLADALNDTSVLTACYNNLGTVFKGLGQNDKAYEYGEKALAIHRQRARKSGIASAQINLGILDARAKRYDQALERYKEARMISKELDDLEGVVITAINMADVYLVKPDLANAYVLLQEADSVAIQINSPRLIIQSSLALASYYRLAGQNLKALDQLSKAEALALTIHEMEKLRDVYGEKAENFKVLGDYKKALEFVQLQHLYADSVTNEEVENNVNELEIKYESEKKERDIISKDLELEKESARTRTRNYLLLASLILIAALVFVIVQRQKLNRQKMLAAEQQRQLELAQMREHERTRIAADMHDDLGSGLTSIRLLSEVALRGSGTHEELEKISSRSVELVSKLSEIIWAMNPANDSLEDLVLYTRAYAAHFLDEAGIQLNFTNNMVPAGKVVTGETRRNVFLVTKEALNNTVKYASATQVSIRMAQTANDLRVEIKDNGRGLDTIEHRHGSQGLKGMKKRIEQMNGSFKIQVDEGTSISFTVPLNLDQKV